MFLVKYFDLHFNRLYKNELELLYGEGAKIVVNNVLYSTNNKSYVVDVKLILGDTTYEDMTDLYSDGLNYLVTESWKGSGFKTKISLIYSVDI
jgi:hypothetical protein